MLENSEWKSYVRALRFRRVTKPELHAAYAQVYTVQMSHLYNRLYSCGTICEPVLTEDSHGLLSAQWRV